MPTGKEEEVLTDKEGEVSGFLRFLLFFFFFSKIGSMARECRLKCRWLGVGWPKKRWWRLGYTRRRLGCRVGVRV